MEVKNKSLVNGLRKIKRLQEKGTVFPSSSFTADELTILKRSGFLKQIIREWYYLSSPKEIDGETTSWYACFYEFLHKYLQMRFGKGYCLNAEASLALHMKQTIIPIQVAVILKKGSTKKQNLPFNTSLFMYEDKNNFPKEYDIIEGLNVFTKELTLCKVGPSYWRDNPLEMQMLLNLVDIRKVVDVLTSDKNGMATSASRIVGAFKHLGRERDANRIKQLYEKTYGGNLRIVNPFEQGEIVLLDKKGEKSIIGARIKGMWAKFREPVLKIGNTIPKKESTIEELSTMIDEIKKDDMYHSLSIEGYKITDELIERVTNGKWNVDENQEDQKERDAMAAKGYHDAFEVIKKDILDAIDDNLNPGELVEDAHQDWYAKLFGPSLDLGLLTAGQLAGYRDGQVYIRGSMHTPLKKEDITDAMEVYFKLLIEEDDAFVKAVVGHHLFGFIHPYMDGNGRMARFIMNCFLVTGGYKWCVITVETRDKYMQALEKASVSGEIEDFAKFIKNSM